MRTHRNNMKGAVMNSTDILAACGLEPADPARGDLAVAPPFDGSYMRRQTSTVNYSRRLPLAQGIRFDI
jgi:hypothetical protein